MKLNMKSILVISMILITCRIQSQIKPQIQWDGGYGGCQVESPKEIIQTADGGYLLGAYSASSVVQGTKTKASIGGVDVYDFWIQKIDSNGLVQWDEVYGGNNADHLNSICKSSDGGYILAGSSNSVISGNKTQNPKGFYDYWIVKINAQGAVQWEKTIGGDSSDYCHSIRQTKDGGYILGGYSNSTLTGDKTNSSKGSADYWIVKLDSVGQIQWDKTIGGNKSDILNSVKQSSDGGYIIDGYSLSDSSGDKSQSKIGTWIVKLDFAGQIQWTRLFESSYAPEFGPGYFFQSLQQTFDGGYILGCTSQSDSIPGLKSQNSKGLSDYWVLKLNSMGQIQWEKTIGGNSQDFLYSILQTTDGGYIMVGGSNSDSSGDKTENRSHFMFNNYWIVKIDDKGKVLWDRDFGGDESDFATHVLQIADGGYIVMGRSQSNNFDVKNTPCINQVLFCWVIKIKDPIHSISGKVFADLNSDCSYSNSEFLFKHKLIRNLKENTYSSTNDSIYKHYLFNNDTAVLVVTNLDPVHQISCGLDTIKVIFPVISSLDTHDINFPIRPNGNACFQPKITSYTNSFLRVCTWSNYIINYQNEGFDTLYNASITVEIDTAQIDSFTSPYAYTLTGNKVVFALGNLPPFSYKSLTYSVKIKCNALLGSAICNRAVIEPLNNCYTYPGFDGSDIRISSICNNDTVKILVENISSAKDMLNWGAIKGYEDIIVQLSDSFKLGKNTSSIFKYKVNPNKVFTYIADIKNGQPVTPVLIRHDDHCAIKTGIVIQNPALSFSRFDESNEYEEDCDIIKGSYDPNDKKVQPEGLFAQHYTKPNETLKYRINFQNVGNDTAFKVVVIDPLSSYLNLSSFEPGASSHPYRVEFISSNILKFIFDPIKLVDSTHNELASHGYVTFKIKAHANIPSKAVVENFANIYFDYNSPILTNTVFNTMYDTVQIFVPKKDTVTKPGDTTKGPNSIHEIKTSIQVYPNPSADKFMIHLNNFRSGLSIEIVDVGGKVVWKMEEISSNTIEVDGSKLSKGHYVLNIKDRGVKIVQQMLIIGD